MGKPAKKTHRQSTNNKPLPFIFKDPVDSVSPLREKMFETYLQDEAEILAPLLKKAELNLEQNTRIEERALGLVKDVRKASLKASGLDQFLKTYDLSSEEGIVLMCLAEALLRIPDAATQDKLIKDKITKADWEKHLGESKSTFVNAGTWALMLTGRVLELGNAKSIYKRMISDSGEPVIRKALNQAMRILGKQFVMGRTIKEALKRSEETQNKKYTYSFDMLGEAAKTAEDAERYFEAYRDAIRVISRYAKTSDVAKNPGISVKLSALHPRYVYEQKDKFYNVLLDKVKSLAEYAKESNIHLCIDAEESHRLDISLDLFKDIYTDSLFEGWHGLGLAVQAYQKRAYYVLDWLIDLSKSITQAEGKPRPIMVRLVKGAYWDSEIKLAQQKGLSDYPVFTRKVNTDVSYMACANKMLAAGNDVFYPQFATHNAQTLSYILELAEQLDVSRFEFQRLHGMGEDLYKLIDTPCRVYAPVGSHRDLLAYLVRRLLENGANSSFVNRIVDESKPVEDLIENPVAIAKNNKSKRHPQIALPVDIFQPLRKNSAGIEFSHTPDVLSLSKAMQEHSAASYVVVPLTTAKASPMHGETVAVINPCNHSHELGSVTYASVELATAAVDTAFQAFASWQITSVEKRAVALEKAADSLEEQTDRFMTLATLEAGKTQADGIAEVREAVDFLRYYANQAREHCGPAPMPGPTGETNNLFLQGKGVFACISPWNFPLAIFVGQVAAALASGNTVVAKPADQTPILASEVVKILHESGIPQDVLHFLPGRGSKVGNTLITHPKLAGVAFTGSTSTAQRINISLAEKDGPIATLIAETGGQNACIVDSSALYEQVVDDVIMSAFLSAGQRCSALRVLYLQEEIADGFIKMLTGAMNELVINDPRFIATDVGPVIDKAAQKGLMEHINAVANGELRGKAKILHQCKVPPQLDETGSFVPPTLIELESLSQLNEENFGPILHIIRYKSSKLEEVIKDINATGYGLTLGIHSRIQETANYITEQVKVGNVYINRNMVGAVVGSQPFGGQGLSGTGPKAGGPHYLPRFCVEKTVTINTTAAGGNATLMSLEQ